LVVFQFMFMRVRTLVEIRDIKAENREIENGEAPLKGVVGVVSTKSFLVVGIPAFNEEHSIARVIMQAQKFADEVIVCDDGSTDMTAEIALRLGAHVISHECNLGYGAALRTLFENAKQSAADVFITLDGDGQHDPSEISAIVKPIVSGEADIVIGSRFVDVPGHNEMPFHRRVGARLITRLVNGSAKNGVRDAQSGFRAYGRDALQRLSVIEAGMGASVEILLSASQQGLKIREVPISCQYKNGEVATSTKNPVTHGFGVVMSFVRLIVDERPLIFLGIPGLLSLLAGVGFGLWMLEIYAETRAIVTNIALASVAFVLISFFLLSTATTLYAISRLAKRMNGAR
jgi:glycosyltransferase involved in cell wall biosynthesis